MRQPRSTPQMMHRAAELRKEMTPAERQLWARLRQNQILNTAFRRQHAVGPYIVDFCAAKLKLVIELDGSPHLNQKEYDTQRSEFLAEKGYRVIRFWNQEVMNHIEDVVRVVETAIKESIEQRADR